MSRLDHLIEATLAFVHQKPQARTAFSVGIMLYRLQAEARPQTVDQLAAATGRPASEVTELMTQVLGLRVDGAGRVSEDAGSLPRYRVRMLDTDHEVELRGCAVDALPVPSPSLDRACMERLRLRHACQEEPIGDHDRPEPVGGQYSQTATGVM